MVAPDRSPRPRRVTLWTAVVVALALAIPVGALLLHDDSAPSSGGAVTTAGGSSPTGPADPSPSASVGSSEASAPTPAPTPAPAPGAAPRGKVRALFFGDSYFIGGGYTEESNSMARLASNRLGWSSVIRGGGGTGFVGGNPEYNLPNYLGQIEQGAFDVGRRSWVVIEGGNNDRTSDPTEVGRNARRVVRIAQRRFPSAFIVLVGPMDTDGDWSDTRPIVKTMRKAAAKRKVAFVSAQKWLKGHYDLIGPDYTHPYPQGHRICARKLTRALRALGA